MSGIERYREMIRECLGGRTTWRVDERRRVDQMVLGYWEGRSKGLGVGLNLFKPGAKLLAARGENVALAAWSGLALRNSMPLAREMIEWIGASQQASGAYFQAGPGDNLETLWYWELIVLHAVAAYGIVMKDPAMQESAHRAAVYHLNETQPDHATTEPWGINAFLLSEETWPLADQVLHTVRVQHPGGVEGVSGILLADALRGLEGRSE